MNETLTAQMKLVSYVQFRTDKLSHSPIIIEGPRNPEEMKKQLGDQDYGFYFFDLLDGKTTLDNREEVAVSSDRFNHSPFYYVGGTLHSKEELRASEQLEDAEFLIYLANNLEISQFYLDRFGKWQVAEEGPLVILTPQQKEKK